MSLADELTKLEALRTKGALSEEEFQKAKGRLLDKDTRAPLGGVSAVNNLRRSLADRWIGGVCGGLAQSTGLDSWVWRLIFAVLLVFGGAGLILYLLLWIFVPPEE